MIPSTLRIQGLNLFVKVTVFSTIPLVYRFTNLWLKRPKNLNLKITDLIYIILQKQSITLTNLFCIQFDRSDQFDSSYR